VNTAKQLTRYDSIVIGAGHNGLVCAAYLVKSGQRVLVLEASDTVGGLGGSREFHPCFHASAATQSVTSQRKWPATWTLLRTVLR